jgi:hypothetical protein
VYVEKNPKKIRDGSTGAVTCDHYHRFKEDFALMKKLGVKNYRSAGHHVQSLFLGGGACRTSRAGLAPSFDLTGSAVFLAKRT